jgi:GTP cyclohydrolase III
MPLELEYVGGSNWLETLRKNQEAIKDAINGLQKELGEAKAKIAKLEKASK